MPILGMMNSGFGGHGIMVFGWQLVARNPDPANPEGVLAYHPLLQTIGHTGHYWLGYILIATIALHIAGALKHHFFDRDKTLLRMLNPQTV